MASFFSAASALLTGKSGPLPNFTIGEREAWFDGRTIWQLHAAVKKDDGSQCSILTFDALQPSHNPRRSLLPLAKNALRRLRTTRHPDVIKLLDSVETPTAVYIAVERIRPLGKVLGEMHKATQHQREEWIGWGLSRVVNALKFLNTDMGVTHGNVRTDSIFLAASGEWRMGGFELTSHPNDEGSEGVLYTLGGMVPDAARYASPEVKQQGWSVLRGLAVHVSDSYALALVILEAYNGALPPRGPSDVSVPPRGRVPEGMYDHVKRMMLPNAKSRLTSSTFAESGFRQPGGFFTENRLCKVTAGLDGFILASEEQRSDVLRTIKSSSTSFPPDFLQFKVLPVLVQAMSIGSGGGPAAPTNFREGQVNHGVTQPAATTLTSPTMHPGRLLPLILQLGQPLSNEDWSRSVAPTIIKAYASPDRAVRMALLESLSTYIERFDVKQVSDRIWPNLLSGFADSSAAMREATVRAIVPVSPKLTERILNNDLLRQLARTQVDVEPRIRTNTTVLLGTLAPKLSLTTRKNVLVPAFVRSLKDTFAHARMAGLMAFMATADSFEGVDCARQIVPAMCSCLLDSDKAVRKQAKEAFDLFYAKIIEAANDMPTTEADAESSKTNGFEGMSGYGGEAEHKAEARNFTNASSDSAIIRSTVTSTPGAVSALARLGPPSEAPTMTASEANDFMTNQAVTTMTTPPSPSAPPKWSSMGDLMDVMDDEDDWTSFNSAPQTHTPSYSPSPARTSISSTSTKSHAIPSSSTATTATAAKPPPPPPTTTTMMTNNTININPTPHPATKATLPVASSFVGVKPESKATLSTTIRPSAGTVRKAVQRKTLTVQDKAKGEEEDEAWDW